MLIVMALTVLLTLGGQTIAEEGDGTTVGDCEILRQVPGAVYLTVEDEGPADDSKE